MTASKNTLKLCNPGNILHYLNHSESFRNLLEVLKKGHSAGVSEIVQEAKGSVYSWLLKLFSKSIVICLRSNSECETLLAELESYLPGSDILFFPGWEILPGEHVFPHVDLVGERMKALLKVKHSNSPFVMVTTIDAVQHKVAPPEDLFGKFLSFKKEQVVDFQSTVENLVKIGYGRNREVSFKGAFGVRGSIIDIFPSNCEYPVRIDLMDDCVETIKLFDASSQRSFKEIDSISVAPVDEAGIVDYKNLESVFSYIPGEAILIFEEAPELRNKAAKNLEYLSHKDSSEFMDVDDILSIERQRLFVSSFALKPDSAAEKFPQLSLDTREIKYYSPEEVGSRGISGSNFSSMVKDLKNWIEHGKTVYIFGNNTGEIDRLREILKEEKVNLELINFGRARLRGGFFVEQANLFVLTDQEIFGRYKRRRPRRKYFGSISPVEIADLNPGDYVVHINHGVGKFLGLSEIKKNNMPVEMAVIEYANNSKLYVPMSKVNLIQRYIGFRDRGPMLDKLGSRKWLMTKAEAQRSIMDYSAELLQIQGARAAKSGFKFSKDTRWQKEFEASFIYEETPDQEKSIREIKEDMESLVPMDRLICGDVGYGKTELAVRAAFKAVMDGKQVAVLVPTTILAKQHLDTFSERMVDYPVCIEMLSRFKTPSEQGDIIKRLAKGAVDIVIGTHRLLQHDIKFKDMGLLIIDEEQRFGVAHKENLKKLRLTVDVLAMSATPIPRTLYMSLAGARDMSTVITPPEDRLPVETIICEYGNEVMREAILREFSRGGQVFYIHNRVQSISGVCERLARLVPQAKFAYAHGQMEEHALESRMRDFVAGSIDVLVSTTIIESGIDIPNANTIIIERADRFGLADLYQLRGRVGRFKRRAYAYLLASGEKEMPEEVKRRLSAMKKFSSLGSGFKIALKDLEIRGAGNILGKKQHGHVAAIGFDLYCKLLKQSVSRLKGEKVVEAPDVYIDLGLYLKIPESYMEDETERLKMYMKISSAVDEKEINIIAEYLEDRFGKIPRSVQILLMLEELKFIAASKKVSVIEAKEEKLLVRKGVRRYSYSFAEIGLDPRFPEKAISTVKKLLQAL